MRRTPSSSVGARVGIRGPDGLQVQDDADVPGSVDGTHGLHGQAVAQEQVVDGRVACRGSRTPGAWTPSA